MSYLVLARKWRPQLWDDIVAQDHVSSTLINAIKHERLAHAYLFSGPRGVGKTSAARILAKSLNCDKGISPVPCNECSICKDISAGRSIDVFEIDGASNRGINEIRSLRENIKYAPANGRYKVYIIDEVHMLTKEAFNALLKTLEEPPEHVIFIFATTEPFKVPATIISRCQRFDFRRISISHIVKSLKDICSKEDVTIDDEAIHLIAKKADGSLRDSQSILDQMISYTEGSIHGEDVIKALGLIKQDIFFEVTEILYKKVLADGMELVGRIISEGYALEEFLNGLIDHLRNFLIVRAVGSAELIETSAFYKKKYIDQSDRFPEEDVLRMIRIVADTKISLRRSMHPRFPIELAMIKMIKMDRTVTIEELIDQIQGLHPDSIQLNGSSPIKQMKSKVDNTPVIKEDIPEKNDSQVEDQVQDNADNLQVKPDTAEEKKNEISLEQVKLKWKELITKLKHKKITIGSFLQEGFIFNVEGRTIEVAFGVKNGFHIDSINRSIDLVNEVLREVFDRDMQIKCIKRNMTEDEKYSAITNEKENILSDITKKDSTIKKLIDNIDAKIVD